VSAVRQATSQKAREVAHPQLFRSMLKDKPALYSPLKWPTRPLRIGLDVGYPPTGFWIADTAIRAF